MKRRIVTKMSWDHFNRWADYLDEELQKPTQFVRDEWPAQITSLYVVGTGRVGTIFLGINNEPFELDDFTNDKVIDRLDGWAQQHGAGLNSPEKGLYEIEFKTLKNGLGLEALSLGRLSA